MTKEAFIDYVSEAVPELSQLLQEQEKQDRLWEAYQIELLAGGNDFSPEVFVQGCSNILGWEWLKS